MASTLRKLSDLIQEAVRAIETSCEASALSFPELGDPYDPASEKIRSLVEVQTNVIAAAASQLVLNVRRPQSTIILSACEHLSSAALGVAGGLNIADILEEAGPTGLRAEDIARQAHADSNKLSRILRFLAAQGIFREVKPDVFANNGPSSVLIKGNKSQYLFKHPESQYSDARSSIAAVVAHLTDESAKGSSYLLDTLTDPDLGFSGEPTQTPFNKAFNFKGTLWDFFELPENKMRETRFGVAMEVTKKTEDPASVLKGYNWAMIPKGSVVVDVGGGVGTVSMIIAKAHEHLKIIVQDRPAVVDNGKRRWEELYPEGLSGGRVTFQAHDFFEKQPVQNTAVFLLRAVIHDWSDAYATKILKRLREAANPQTRLLCVDRIIPYACRVPEDTLEQQVPGLVKDDAPEAIFANYSSGNPMPFVVDINMMVLVNGQERTLKHFQKLFSDSGWRITRVHQTDALAHFGSHIEAVPIEVKN